MLLRHVLGYIPSGVVPAITSFATVIVFSRSVAPATYGAYALAISVSVVSQAVFFTWLQMGATRFAAGASEDGSLNALSRSIYTGFLLCAGLFALGLTAGLLLLPVPAELHPALWLAMPLVGFKALVAVNQAFHRSAFRIGRYTVLEAGQAVLGFALAALFVLVLDMDAVGMVLGPAVAAAACAAIDIRSTFRALFSGPMDLVLTRKLLRFGLPLTASFAMEFVLATSDRLLVEYFLGAAAVGVYAVSYGIAERALTSVFMIIATASFPLVVRALEKGGDDDARRQMHTNGIAMLALGVPACTGVVMLAPHLAMVLVGADYRADATAIMPWVAVSALAGGLKTHYLDHAFYLGRRTDLFLVVAGPAAALNVALNLVLLPTVGLLGAAWATLASYLAALIANMVLARRVFPFQFPWGPLGQIIVASATMAMVLRLLALPPTALGLFGMVAAGATTYGAASLALNIGGARNWIRQAI